MITHDQSATPKKEQKKDPINYFYYNLRDNEAYHNETLSS